MIKLKEYITLTEGVDDKELEPVVILPGRFQPPTVGHRLGFTKLLDLSEKLNAKPVILIIDSQKYDARNPLTGEMRHQYLSKMYPEFQYSIGRNAYELIETLYKENNQVPIGGVTGGDRGDTYKGLIGRIFGNKASELYENIVIHRDPDSLNEIIGATATKAREAALIENEPEFRALTGLNHEDGVELMRLIRRVTGKE